MSKVLMIVMWSLFSEDGKADGTRVRCFEIAKALKRKNHEVVIAQTNEAKEAKISGIQVININRENMNKIIRDFDVIISYPNEFTFNLIGETKNKPVVMDLYDPVIMNDVFLDKKEEEKTESILHLLNAFSASDLFLCANDRQRVYYSSILTLLGKYEKDRARIVIVPFGIPDEELKSKKPLIKGVLVPKENKVILWPGPMYPWFDPQTMFKAMERVFKKRNDIALVFVGSNHFQNNIRTSEAYESIRKKAEANGLLNTKVFFIPWLPYNERAAMYLESDLAIVTYKSSIENELSYRTRLIDCIWGELPIICTEGDVLSKLIEEKRMGFSVKEGDADEIIKRMIELMDSPKEVKKIKERIRAVKKELSWDNAIKLLDDFCQNPELSKKKQISFMDKITNKLQKEIEENKSKIENLNKKTLHDDGMISHLKEENAILHKEKAKLSRELYREKLKRSQLEKDILRLEKEKENEVKRIISEKEGLRQQKDKDIRRIQEQRQRDINILRKQKDKKIQEITQEKEEQIKQKDKKIQEITQEKEEQIKQKDKEIQKQKTLNQQKKEELLKIREELDNLRKDLELTNQELAWRKEALDSIYNSRLYKYLGKHVWDLHNKLIKKKKTE